MPIHPFAPCIVLAVVLLSAMAHAGSGAEPAGPSATASDGTTDPGFDDSLPAEGIDAENAWERAQAGLYDLLAADSSPRMQVLVARVWVPESSGALTALRPNREDVIARAISFAPDDAVVQWIAATDGQYETNHCGLTAWPDVEVDNLQRLEPDNAGAWQYAVALTHAKGDEAGVDEALSRMAAASRADDHLVEEIAAWTTIFRAHTEIAGSPYAPYADYSFGASNQAMLTAMGQVGPIRATDEPLTAVCSPDGSSERTWRRLGWCLDAGHLLAEKGSSLALRRSGVTMLKATGDTSEETSGAERQNDWLAANDANPMRHFLDDDPGNVPASLADWHGAKSEIAAIEHRLKRLGLPLSPPPGWTKPPAETDDERDAKENAAAKAFKEYLSSLFADMRVTGAPHARVFAIDGEAYVTNPAQIGRGVPIVDEAAQSAAAAKRREAIAPIAAANTTDLKTQWQVALADDAPPDAKENAIATVQQAEGDNAAAWALSLAYAKAGDALVDSLLQRMAASTRYDLHAIYAVSAMLETMQRHPIPPEVLEAGWWKPSKRVVSAGEGAKYVALFMSYMGFEASVDVADKCVATTASARRDACVAIGRLLVHKGLNVQNVRIGEGILRRLRSLESTDAARARRIHWWYDVMERQARSESVDPYLDAYIATGNQIEALERNAEQRGRAEPPANWKPRRWISVD